VIASDNPSAPVNVGDGDWKKHRTYAKKKQMPKFLIISFGQQQMSCRISA
jgi:hypothetical protein